MIVNNPVVLSLKGTPREMGYAHGAALREQGACNVLLFYANLIHDLLFFEVDGPWDLRRRSLFEKSVVRPIERLLIEQIPVRYREMTSAFAETSGLSEDEIFRAHVMPDVYLILLAQFSKFREQTTPIQMGCTSIVAQSIHARSLDYLGGQRWSQHPAILEYVPNDGQKYVSFVALGVDTGGITSINESGITLALHVNYSKKISPAGTPVLVIGDEVMRRAKTLAEAVEIIRMAPRTAGWTFVITSKSEKLSLAVEVDASATHVRYAERGKLVATNHFFSDELRKNEYWLTEGRKIDSVSRHERASEMVDQISTHHDGIQADAFVPILRDRFDSQMNVARSFGNTITQVHSLSSIIFDSDHQEVLWALGQSPSSLGSFHSFEVFPNIKNFGIRVRAAVSGKSEALCRYAKAFDRFFPKGDFLEAERFIREACDLDPTDPKYLFVLGLVQMKLSLWGVAEQSFRRALELPNTEREMEAILLWLGRSLDVQARRPEALEQYRKILNGAAQGRAAKKGMRKAYRAADTKHCVLDLTLGDFLDK